MIKMNKILIVSPHQDDAEINCGGTISKLIESGAEVTVLALSHIYGELDLSDEFVTSMKFLNVKDHFIGNFTTRYFERDRQEILQSLYDIRNDFDTIFFSNPDDHNSDHSTVGFECLRAFKNHNLIAYGSPFNSLHLSENLFIELSPEHLLRKIDAIKCYKSQAHRVYMQPTVIEAQAITRGLQCGYKYAEAFKIIKLRS